MEDDNEYETYNDKMSHSLKLYHRVISAMNFILLYFFIFTIEYCRYNKGVIFYTRLQTNFISVGK